MPFVKVETEEGWMILNTDTIAQVRPSVMGKSDFPTTVIVNQFVPHIRLKMTIDEFWDLLIA